MFVLRWGDRVTPPPAQTINIFEYVLPLFAGRKVLEPTVVEGTAFGIGGGCFLTAAHCIREAMALGWMAVGTIDGKRIRAWNIPAWELADDYDIALFRAEVDPPVSHFCWRESELPMAASIRSSGYPYALDLGRQTMNVRSFVGNVVSATTFDRLKPQPPSYELSFQCPRGLSGAPLLSSADGGASVVGIIIGNQTTEMTVFTSREHTSEHTEQIVERYEALQLGVAIQTRAIMDLTFPKLLEGRTLRQHLVDSELISGPPGKRPNG